MDTSAAIPGEVRHNRWGIAVAGTVLQLCLGTVYAWSCFQNRFPSLYGWTNTQVALTFCVAIGCLGLAAAWGGINLAKYGPRLLAMTGGTLFAAGYLLSALALSLKSLWLLYLGYGVIGGAGLGLGYVTPVATAAKWFPDKKGLVTGMVVMGFGFGALLMSKVLLPVLVGWTGENYVQVFLGLGAFFLVVTLLAASFLRNPPPGFVPQGRLPASGSPGAPAADDSALTAGECLTSGRFLMMWIVFFCNIAAGIAIISFQSPLIVELWRERHPGLSDGVLAGYGATLVAISSLFNGAGRFFWGSLSDRIGRSQAFRLMLATQIVAFILLILTRNPWVFGALVCYVLLCYGGGFGTMPSFILDVFGAKMMAVAYGVILTAWSAAGIAGPQIVARLKDRFAASPGQASKYSFLAGAAMLAVGLVLTLFLRDHRHGRKQA